VVIFAKPMRSFSSIYVGNIVFVTFLKIFLADHNILGIWSSGCPLNGVLPEVGRKAKSQAAGRKIDFPDRFSVLRRSGDLSENEISTILKKEQHD
jgi:hypothetical protein